MEHADIISGSYTYTKEAFFGLKHLPRWIVLFLYFVIPILVCLAIVSFLFQFAVLPLLVSVFVNDNYGFTASSLSGLLQYLAVIISLACVFFVPLIQGYCYRIAKSDGEEMPDHTNIWTLFFRGWQINFVILYYAIPIIVISLIYAMIFYYLFPEAGLYLTIDVLALESLFTVLITLSYVAIEFITVILVSLFAFVGLVHLTRSGSLEQATHFRGIAAIIKRIGWYDYILSRYHEHPLPAGHVHPDRACTGFCLQRCRNRVPHWGLSVRHDPDHRIFRQISLSGLRHGIYRSGGGRGRLR